MKTFLLIGLAVGAYFLLKKNVVELFAEVDRESEAQLISGPDILTCKFVLKLANVGNVPMTIKTIKATQVTPDISAVFYQRLENNASGPIYDGSTMYDILIKPNEDVELLSYIQVNKAQSVIDKQNTLAIDYELSIMAEVAGKTQLFTLPVTANLGAING